MKNFETNMADQTLIVKNLKVLGKMDGGDLREIRMGTESIRKQLNVSNKQQEQYWEQLSDDGIVSVIEKQVLLREMDNIQKSEAAITSQAVTYGYTGAYLQSFIETYEALHTYLYDTLKVFDDMSVDTPIGDRSHFNELFSNYYWFENLLLLAISAGILDQINFRVLSSLTEEGEEGETGIYKGGLYQYTNGAWKSVSTGAYKGPRTELPGIEEGAFFIVSETFNMTDTLIVNGTELLVNGEELMITRAFLKGYIYYCEDGVWYAEDDQTNWRYAAAFADVINITGRLPQLFQDSIDDLQEQIDDKIEHVPAYLGAVNITPYSAQEGDFFTWAGTTYGDRENSKVYLLKNGVWQGLDPTVSTNRSYYMQALEDVLACQNISNGYFAAIFAQSFFTNEATMNSLSTRTIYLRYGGYIQSENTQYVPQAHGLRIDNDGNIDANGDTHIGGNCTIDGNTTIGGNASFAGRLNGADGSFKGTLNGVNGSFTTLTIADYIRSADEIDFGPGVGVRPRFILRQNGSVESYGAFYFGSDVVIAGNCNIGTNATFSGRLEGAEGRFTGKLETADICQAAGFVLSGLQPGYISLIRMDVPQNKSNAQWQIPASGRIKIYGIATPEHVYEYGSADISIYVNSTRIYYADTHSGAVTIDFDFDVNAGDVIKIYPSTPVGVAGMKTNFSGGLCTNTYNPLVTYLGHVVTDSIGPIPR